MVVVVFFISFYIFDIFPINGTMTLIRNRVYYYCLVVVIKVILVSSRVAVCSSI